MEEVAGDWLVELFGRRRGPVSVFTAGGTAAHQTALAAARHALLAAEGWDVERRGLYKAPEDVRRGRRGGARDAGPGAAVPRARPRARVRRSRPTTRAGCGPTRWRAARPVPRARPRVRAGRATPTPARRPPRRSVRRARPGAWLHVDGAFGLWAAASPALRHLVDGHRAPPTRGPPTGTSGSTSRTTPVTVCADPNVRATAMAYNAPYLPARLRDERSEAATSFPGSSRRARGFATWAAIRSLGRTGVADLVERCCRLARRFADRLDGLEGVEVVNDVVLNQVLSVRVGDGRCHRSRRSPGSKGRHLLARRATWRGGRLIRISVSNWSTTEADVDRSADAILSAVRRLGAAPPEVVVPLRAQPEAAAPPSS